MIIYAIMMTLTILLTTLMHDNDHDFDDDFDNNDDDGDDFVTGFDKHPLVLAENPRTHQFYVPLDSPKVE